ncbi:MAG: alkaline phosphatase family protein [Myxococcota bacterium]
MRTPLVFARLGTSALLLINCATPPASAPRATSTAAEPAAPVAPPAAAANNAPAAPANAAVTPAASEPAPRGAGKVAVAIIIDQLPSWAANERLPHLPNGGFARLRREGTWVKNSVYLHAATETAPGHASLFSGRTPREHRIVANAVWRNDFKRVGSLLEDANVHPIGPDGIDAKVPGVSLANVRGQLLADVLRERDPRAVVVALSLKDRGAAFACGRAPNACLWYNDSAGILVSSTAFNKEGKLPSFAQSSARVVAPGSTLTWPLFDRAFVEAHQQTPDDQPGESAMAGGRSFPHSISGPAVFNGFRLTPSADALLAELALASLALRQPEHPMLLSVSFSANDIVGHTYGPHSWEAWNELAALDATLARFFDGLDAALGADGYSVVLSADHGIVPLPEFVRQKRPDYCNATTPDWHERPCAPGLRVVSAKLEKSLNTTIQRVLGLKAPPIAGIVDSHLILNESARALPAPQQKALDLLLRALLKREAGVAEVFAFSEFGEDCPAPNDESLRALVCRVHAEDVHEGFYNVPGEYYVALKPGYFWGGTDGVNHGSPYRYDRSVPLLVRYPGAPRERVVEQGVFGSFYASLWYALTGEVTSGPYGGVVGAR